MKRQALLLAVCGVLGFFGVGCGPTTDDSTPQAGDQSTEESPSQVGTPDENSQGGGSSDDREVHEMARNCTTTCTAVRIDTGAACANVIGYGSTTFLGGCTKACRFAHQDAESNAAAASCRLTGCADSCH
jgi:hypothetical protein